MDQGRGLADKIKRFKQRASLQTQGDEYELLNQLFDGLLNALDVENCVFDGAKTRRVLKHAQSQLENPTASTGADTVESVEQDAAVFAQRKELQRILGNVEQHMIGLKRPNAEKTVKVFDDVAQDFDRMLRAARL